MVVLYGRIREREVANQKLSEWQFVELIYKYVVFL